METIGEFCSEDRNVIDYIVRSKYGKKFTKAELELEIPDLDGGKSAVAYIRSEILKKGEGSCP